MADTRTWLTTPVGQAPADDQQAEEYWVPGPAIPDEPRVPFRYRGVVALLLVLAGVIGLTFVLAPVFLDVQDPTFSDQAPATPSERLDDTDFDPTFERPTSN